MSNGGMRVARDDGGGQSPCFPDSRVPNVPEVLELLENPVDAVAAEVAAPAEIRHPIPPVIGFGDQVAE